MIPFDVKLTHHDLDARNHRLLDRAAGYARVLVAQVTGRPVRYASVFCYTAPGSRLGSAIYDRRAQSVGMHKYLLENITKHLDAAQKDTLEGMLVRQQPFEDLFAIENCTSVIAALIHEHAHHQFSMELYAQIRALFRRRGESLFGGIDDLRVKAINEGFAYAVQEKATGFIALSEENAQEYRNTNILAQYYAALCASKLPLADTLLDLIQHKGFPGHVPVQLLSRKERQEQTGRRRELAQHL